MNDCPAAAHGEDVRRAAAPDRMELAGHPGAHLGPLGPVVVDDGSPAAHGEEILRSAAPDTLQVRREMLAVDDNRLADPVGAVEVHNCAT